MKVLFIGPYRQTDGWGNESKAFLRALLDLNIKNKIELSVRPIFLSSNINNDNEFEALEIKKQDKYDVVIQHCLPEHFHYVYGSKNIGLFPFETYNIHYTPWISKINLLDELWVVNKNNKIELERLGCTTKIFVIQESVDVNVFKETYKKINNTNFVFYTIGDGYRKNIEALLIAFHREFDRNEPVDLLLKTNKDKEYINEIKNKLALYNNINQYKQEILINKFLTDKEIYEIHANCDCFVMPSYGEGVCRPALEALGFGNTPIITDNTGMSDYINVFNGWIVKSYETPVFSPEKPLPYLYTSRETWRQIDILELQKAMREVYSNKNAREMKSAQGKIDILQYSYDKTANIIYERLF